MTSKIKSKVPVRLNLTIPYDYWEQLKALSEAEGTKPTTKAWDYLKESLDDQEDAYFLALAEERMNAPDRKFVDADEFWESIFNEASSLENKKKSNEKI